LLIKISLELLSLKLNLNEYADNTCFILRADMYAYTEHYEHKGIKILRTMHHWVGAGCKAVRSQTEEDKTRK